MARGDFTMIENPVPWPNGARCAMSFTWDMDADSILHLAHPDDADTRVAIMTDLRFGAEVAVPRICRVFESYGLKVSFFVPAWCIEEHPAAVERMMEGGHEIAHHGYMHELPNTFTKERETYWTQRSTDISERVTGKKPAGNRAPWGAYSKHTTDILTDAGFLYDSSLLGDDVPYVVKDRSGRELIEIPVKWSLDDWPHYEMEVRAWGSDGYLLTGKGVPSLLADNLSALWGKVEEARGVRCTPLDRALLAELAA